MKKQYYSLVQLDETATLNIYGDITSSQWQDSDVTAYNLSKQLDEMQGVKQLDVYINSYGGEVAEGLAIYNALKRKGQTAKVTTYCDGFACSIASVIFMAGTERKMSKSSLLMIHNAWTLGQGNAEELRKIADDLEIITSASDEAYKEVATISEKKIRELMDAESWITPKDAKKYGFVTEILEETAENPSQSVKNTLISLIMAAKSEEEEETPETEEETEEQPENEPEDEENGEDTTEPEEQPEEQEETEEENPKNEEKPTEISGFFNLFLKI